MTEEVKKEDVKQELGNASVKRINQITHHIKELYRAIYGTLNADEFLAIGLDTIFSGLQLINRSNDMEQLTVDERISTMKMIQSTINSVFNKVYLNTEVVANMVAKATIEDLDRNTKIKGFKK